MRARRPTGRREKEGERAPFISEGPHVGRPVEGCGLAKWIPVGPSTELEREAFEKLRRNLGDALIFTNVLVHYDGGSKEFDAIVLTPVGGYTIDLKAWRGAIREESDGNWSAHGDLRENALRSMALNTRPVYSKLKQLKQLRHYNLRELVVFSHTEELDFPPEARSSILTLKEAYNHIHRGVGLDKRDVRRTPLEWLEKTIPRHLRFQPAHRNNLLEKNWRITNRTESAWWTECEVEHPELGTARAKLFPYPPELTNAERGSYKEKVKRELRALLALQEDERILSRIELVRAANSTDDFFYLILDQPKGEPLLDWLKKSPNDQARAKVALQVAKTVGDIHTQGVVHRNLQPESIYVTARDHVVLRNFDFSKPIHGGESGVSAHIPAIAHPDFVAPEVLIDPKLADRYADVYSTGKLVEKILAAPEAATVAPILEAATSPGRADRPADAAELALALEQALRAAELAAQSEIEVGKTVANGRFRILDKLGEGGFCPVFLAEDLERSDRRVALKMYPATSAERIMLENEARILEEIHHKHIVKVYDMFTHADKLLLALQYVEGPSLRAYTEEHGLPDLQLAPLVAAQLLRAVTYLAELPTRVVHRDISSRNIVLTGTGSSDDPFNIKLIDFGLAAFTSNDGGRIGTQTYRAPEADRGSERWTIQHELYSVGVIVSELLLGRLPYGFDYVSTDDEPGPVRVPRKDIMIPPTPEELAPIAAAGLEPLLEVALQACAHDPAKRPASARRMLNEVEPPAEPAPATLPAPSTGQPAAEAAAVAATVGIDEPHAVPAATLAPTPVARAAQGEVQPLAASGGRKGKVILARYGGLPPTSEQIARSLNLKGRFHYVTATKAQSRLRDASPDLQEGLKDQLWKKEERTPQEPLHAIVFRDFITQQLQSSGVVVLSRALEQAFLVRAARKLVENDPAAASRLQQDVESWRRAMETIEENGAPQPGDIPPHLVPHLVHPDLATHLSRLHENYTRLQDGERAYSWARGASLHIDIHYRAPPIVVMEGFTRLTDLQRRFIRRCRDQGSIVYLVHPYDHRQADGFDALDHLWPDPDGVIALESTPMEESQRLHLLQQHLWSSEPSAGRPPDASLTLEEYPHRHVEIQATIDRIRAYLAMKAEDGTPKYKPKDIAVITRDTQLFQSMLVEESERKTLPFKFDSSARLLLLTPPGRFILALYNVWQDGELAMSDADFADILASGFAGPVQTHLGEYDAVRAQCFANATTYADWKERLEQLRQHAARRGPEPSQRLPSSIVKAATVDDWLSALDLVQTLAGRLFAEEGRTIREHIRALMDALSAFAPVQMMKTQREMLNRIQEVLTELEQSGAKVPVTAEEFAGMVHRLVAQGDPTSAEKDDPEAEGSNSSIWLTTPEGIDGYTKPIVFYISLDTLSAPSSYVDPWPFAPSTKLEHHQAIDRHRAKERYAFLAVTRAATDALHLSYARLDADNEYRPSIFLREAAATLEESLTSISLDTKTVVQAPAGSMDVGPVPVASLTFHQVAHYLLCPYRFLMERTNSEVATYRSRFQLRMAAKGAWLRLMLDHARTQPPTIGALEDVLRDSAMETFPQMRELFPGFRAYDWDQVKPELMGTIEFYGSLGSSVDDIHQVPAVSYKYLIHDADEVKLHYPRVDEVPGLLIRDAELHLEWLLPVPAMRGEDGKRTYVQPGATERDTIGFEEKQQAVAWWTHHLDERAPPPNIEVHDAIEAATSGKYPKNPGNHCKLCPAYRECLGK